MKLCMMSIMMGQMPPREIVKIAADCGMEAIDWISTHNTDPGLLRKISEDAGLVVAAHTMLKRKFINGEPGYLDEFKETLADAVTLGTKILMVPPFALKNQTSLEESRKRWKDYYAETLPLAQDAGIILTVESTGFDVSPITTGEEIRELIDAMPGLQVTFDYGNTATAGDADDAYRMLRDRIVHFHLKDWKIYNAPHKGASRKRCGRYFADTLIGTGDLPLKHFWKHVVAGSYSGYVNLETIDFSGRLSPAEAMKQTADFLRNW